MFNTKIIYGKPLKNPGRYSNYQFPKIEKKDPVFEFNQSVIEAKEQYDLLITKIKSHGGTQSIEFRNITDLPAVSSIQNNQFSALLDIFSINRKKLSDVDFEILTKAFKALNVQFRDLTSFYTRKRPLTTFNYAYPLFKFAVDFFGRKKIKVDQIIAIKAGDLPKGKTGDIVFNEYLNSQFSHNYGSDFFIQSVNFTVK